MRSFDAERPVPIAPVHAVKRLRLIAAKRYYMDSCAAMSGHLVT